MPPGITNGNKTFCQICFSDVITETLRIVIIGEIGSAHLVNYGFIVLWHFVIVIKIKLFIKSGHRVYLDTIHKQLILPFNSLS